MLFFSFSQKPKHLNVFCRTFQQFSKKSNYHSILILVVTEYSSSEMQCTIGFLNGKKNQTNRPILQTVFWQRKWGCERYILGDGAKQHQKDLNRDFWEVSRSKKCRE